MSTPLPHQQNNENSKPDFKTQRDEELTGSGLPVGAKISQYHNFFAVQDAVRLGVITEADAIERLGLKGKVDLLKDVELSELSGYKDQSLFAALVAPAR